MTLPKGGKKSGGPAAPRAVPLNLPGASEEVATFEGSAQFLQLGAGPRGVAAAPDLNTVVRSTPAGPSPQGRPPRAAGAASPHVATGIREPQTSLQNFMPERQEAVAAPADETADETVGTNLYTQRSAVPNLDCPRGRAAG